MIIGLQKSQKNGKFDILQAIWTASKLLVRKLDNQYRRRVLDEIQDMIL